MFLRCIFFMSISFALKKNLLLPTFLKINNMSKDNIINNLFRVASNMFTQFNTEEPLVSDETKKILNDKKARNELYKKIINNPKSGEVSVNIEGKEIKFLVEA